jgi:hypothetical protein
MREPSLEGGGLPGCESGECHLVDVDGTNVAVIVLYPSPPVERFPAPLPASTIVERLSVHWYQEQLGHDVTKASTWRRFRSARGVSAGAFLLVVGRRWDPCGSSEVSTRRGPL